LKLGLIINVFEGTEHLEAILTELRGCVDLVVLLWQKVSYFGTPLAPEDREEVKRLRGTPLVDECVEFFPNLAKDPLTQERTKRNLAVHIARERGMSHVLVIDSDEFYLKEPFLLAKAEIEEHGFVATYCTYINYYKDFDHRLVYDRAFFVPFIHETSLEYELSKGPGPIDSTRTLGDKGVKTAAFPERLIQMHHAAWIRKDIQKKLANWSNKALYTSTLLAETLHCWDTWEEGQDAVMLFVHLGNRVPIEREPNGPLSSEREANVQTT